MTGGAVAGGAAAFRARAAAAGRLAASVVVPGALGALLWLVAVQEGPERDLTRHDVNQIMGQLLTDAGGDVARAGLYAHLVAGVLLAAVYAAVVDPLLGRRGGLRAALAFAPVPFLLWGLVLSPLATAYEDTGPAGGEPVRIPGGVFGADGGTWPVVLAAIGSLAFALMVARGHRLMRNASWWRPRAGGHGAAREVLEEMTAGTGSLELPEERRYEGGEGPR